MAVCAGGRGLDSPEFLPGEGPRKDVEDLLQHQGQQIPNQGGRRLLLPSTTRCQGKFSCDALIFHLNFRRIIYLNG